MSPTTAEEVERLKAAELDAERRYVQAMERGDLATARSVADEWRMASNALTDYVAKHPYLYQDCD